MKAAKTREEFSPNQRADLPGLLQARFENNPQRHTKLGWAQVKARLDAHPGKLRALAERVRTGGEPRVVGHDAKTGDVIFFDCSAQSPQGRESLCYDREALGGRKKFPPKGCVTEAAAALGAELLDEAQYFALQQLGKFDTKSSSWVKTPPEIRQLGGAIYGDRRYNRVFIGHNGADSYYSGRGFRCSVRV